MFNIQAENFKILFFGLRFTTLGLPSPDLEGLTVEVVKWGGIFVLLIFSHPQRNPFVRSFDAL